MTTPASRNTFAAVIAVIAVVGALSFYNTVHEGYTNFDDLWQVANNSLVKAPATFDNVTGILFAPYHGEYQPVKLLSYLADDTMYGAIGMNVYTGMHLTNVLLHIVNAILVALICIAVVSDLAPDGGEGHMAFFVGLLAGIYFVVHPIHVESVAWLSSRKDLLSFLFMAVSFLALRSFIHNGGLARALFSLGLFALALASKTVVASMPLIALAYWALLGWKGGIRVAGLMAGLFALAAADVALGMVIAADAGFRSGPLNGSYVLHFLSALKTFPFYMNKLLFPVSLSAIYTPNPASGFADVGVWLGAALLAAQLAVAVFARAKAAKFIVLWYILALVPVLQFVPTMAIPAMAADRYAYVASVPFALAPALILWRVRAALAARGALALAAALMAAGVVYAGVLGIETHSRNRVWYSSEALWRDVIKKNPRSNIALVNLGQTYLAEGNHEAARHYLREAVRVDPGFLIAYNNLAESFEVTGMAQRGPDDTDATGDLLQAKALYSQAMSQPSTLTAESNRTQFARAALGLARISYTEHRYVSARSYADSARNFNSGLRGVATMWLDADNAVKDSRAVADELLKAGDEAAEGDASMAERSYLHAADAAVEYTAPHVRLGRLYALHGKWDDAYRQYSIAAGLGAADAEFQYNYAVAAIKMERFHEAAETLSKALTLDPTMAKAKVKLAIAKAYLGEPAQALLLLKDVLEEDPSNSEARENFNAVRKVVEQNIKSVTDAAKPSENVSRPRDAR